MHHSAPINRVLLGFIVAGAILVTGLLVATSMAAAEEIHTIDDNTALDEDETIEQYQQDGIASADAPQLNMTITVAEDKREAGMDGYTEGMHTYLRVQYNESINRTVRFYLPAAYAEPRLKQGLESKTDPATATLEPVAGGEYTAVTVKLRGETDATFSINRAFGIYISSTDRAYGFVERTTGWSMPQLGSRGHEQWHYPPDGALEGPNATYNIPTDPEKNDSGMTIQYDSSAADNESTWVAVPKCRQAVDPVCVAERNGQPVLFAANSSDVPPIRYKYGDDTLEDARSGWEKVKDGWSDLYDEVTGVFSAIAAPTGEVAA